jgi:endoglucanase
MKVDALGNLIVRKGRASENGRRVMLTAHLDEIGLIASHVDEHGFVRVSNLGAVHAEYCMGQRVRFLNGVTGVISHEVDGFSRETIALERLFVDVGASSPEDCPVQVGDVAVFQQPFEEKDGRWISKALDNRVSVAVLLEALRRLEHSPHEVWFVFTVLEEAGRKGAAAAAYGIDPEVAIVIDVTSTGDTPKGRRMAVALGKGPAIKVKDAGVIAYPPLVQLIADTAARLNLPVQREILLGGVTDASVIQSTRAGVPSGGISIPTRYVHSPLEMVDARDVQQTLELLLTILENPIQL